MTAYGLDAVSPTAITFLNKALLRRDLGDVVLLNDLDLSRDYTEQCLLGYRTAWRIVHDDFEIEQSVVLTLYLTNSHDTIRTAIGRDIEHPGRLAGFADRRTDEIFVIAEHPVPFRTIGHETANLALRLPVSWISEGLAEYVGHATGDQVDPTPDYLGRLYDALSVRRAASVSGTYTIEGLLNWDWGAATAGEAALFYAQSWWFTDYLVGNFGKQDMRGFITALARSDFYTAFLESFGVGARVTLEDFLAGALDGSGAGGPIGNSLFEVAELATERSALAAEWNALIAAPGSGGSKRAEWQRLSERYAGLSQQMTALEVEAPALAARTTYADAFIGLSEAAQYYSRNSVALGNAALAGGNTKMGEGNGLLNGLAGQYLWSRA